MNGAKNVEETDEEGKETEETDFAGFEFVRQVKAAGSERSAWMSAII